MICHCNQQQTKKLKIEANLDKTPIFCSHCGENLKLEHLPISSQLATEISHWVKQFGQWVEFERARLIEGGEELELVHNHLGKGLAGRFSEELGEHYEVTYVKTTSEGAYTS